MVVMVVMVVMVGNGFNYSTYHLVIESDALESQRLAINGDRNQSVVYAIDCGIGSDVLVIDGILEPNLWSLFVVRDRNSLIPTFV